MRCPSCGDEFEADILRCPTCRVALLGEGEEAAAEPTAVVGRFHPSVAREIVRLLIDRGVPAATEDRDGAVTVLVPDDLRDALRAEVAVGYDGIVSGIEDDATRAELREQRAVMPGWHDAPSGAWVDREGRLRVGAAADEEAAEDARRTLGPALLVLGGLLLLLGWYAGGELRTWAVVAGVPLLIVGVFVPR